MTSAASELPVDELSSERLAAQGLRMALVSPENSAEFEAYVSVLARGLLYSAPEPERLPELRRGYINRRATAIYDDEGPDPATPIATILGWGAELTMPGGELPFWSITGVTVAPTHRRRGIARAMLEGVLRTAKRAGFAMAGLTVTEATIYGRYGFGPASWTSTLEIDTRRAGWRGPEPQGTMHLVPRDIALASARDIATRTWRWTPGDQLVEGMLLTNLFGRPSDPDGLRSLRFLRYDDAKGMPQGFAVYRIHNEGDDITSSSLELKYLGAATDDAYAGLWKFILEHDLVATVTAEMRSVDEPLRWLVADPRAIRTTAVNDHHWLRILDLPKVLASRTGTGPVSFTLAVDDPLGHADGTWRVAATANGQVSAELCQDAADLEITVADLSSLLLGGAHPSVLARAGRVSEKTPGSIAKLAALLASDITPWLSADY